MSETAPRHDKTKPTSRNREHGVTANSSAVSVSPILQLQRTIGNQAVQRLLSKAAPEIQRQDPPTTIDHKLNFVEDKASNRTTVVIDGIPVAEVAITDPSQEVVIEAKVEGNTAEIVLKHHGNASLAASNAANASSSVIITMREIDLSQSNPNAQLNTPALPGADNQQEVEIRIIPREDIALPGDSARSEVGPDMLAPPGALSEFEENFKADRSLVLGGVQDPDSGEIIGYSTPATTGVTKIVDREGTLVAMHEIGLETPPLDPIDFIPTPGSVAKTAGGIAGKVILKGAAKKGSAKGVTIAMGAIVRMRGVSRALASRAARNTAQELVGFVARITEAGLNHSFDRHAAQWFGGQVARQTHMAAWRALVERTAASSLRFAWSTGASDTVAYLARIEGKPFVVQFFRETGELATAFVPSNSQLSQMLRLLGKVGRP